MRERRRRLLAPLGGRVLDLAGDDRHRDLYRAADQLVCRAEPPPSGRGPPFDHVVSMLQLASASDPAETVASIAGVLAEDGVLVFMEPVADPGWRRGAQRMAGVGARMVTGWRVDLDVPDIIASNGLVLIDLERIPMPRYQWPVHGFVQGRARCRRPAAASP
jgi:SAM-dependent methyltransferase